MSALSVQPTRPGPSRLAPPRLVRALALELKRSAVPYLLPLLAVLFYYDTVRTASAYPPVWTMRASLIDHNLLTDFTVFAGGLAAWEGAREGRRKTADLLATTPRAAWSRLSVALAGTLCWLLLAFLACVTVLYVQTAMQATAGGPPLWPVFVGAAGVTVMTVIGFTAGAVFPGRFTAPLVALGMAVLYEIGFREALLVKVSPGKLALPSSVVPPLQVVVFHALSSGTYALLSPTSAPLAVDAGVYYRVVPDLSIVQVMFMGGIAVTLFGVLGLTAGLRGPGRSGGWLARLVAVVLVACGVAASWTGFALAGTAKPDTVAGGWEIPALHSAASDQPVAATPDCTSAAGFQVCVDPALSFDLPAVTAELDPLAAQITGLPGAPARAEEVASVNRGKTVMAGISGNPPVFKFTTDHVDTVGTQFDGADNLAGWRTGLPQGLLDAFLSEPSPAAGLNQAQQAVEDALLASVGAPPAAAMPGPSTLSVSAAAQRFEALPAGARHAWLAAHLAALRAGKITVAQLP